LGLGHPGILAIPGRKAGIGGSSEAVGLLACVAVSYIRDSMYADFRAKDRWSGEEIRCTYQALIVAIATRHADAVDIKFLANGQPVWIALPHPAWVEYNKRTGKILNDALAVEIAGHYLKWAIESGEGIGREMYTLTVEETLKHLDELAREAHALQAK